MRLFKKNEVTKWDMFIGEKIRKAREDKGWTQKQLADAIYKSQGNISDYERGKLQVNAVDLMGIAHVLEKPITFFSPPGVCGIPLNELTDREKELVHYAAELPDELFELLLDQAKRFAEIATKADIAAHLEEVSKERLKTKTR
jgi:transcriptional regulator with XRE-family HTH domain